MLKKKRTSITIGLIITAAFTLLVMGFQQNPYFETVNAQSGMASLTLEASAAKTDHLQVEPISLKLALSNRSYQPVAYRGALMIGRSLNFVSHNESGEEIRLEGSKYIGLIKQSLRTMAAGEQIQQDILLDRGLSEQIFPRPGRYDLRVEFVYSSDAEDRQRVKISSNSVPVNISEPTGINRQAYEYIKGPLAMATSKTDVRFIALTEQDFIDKYRGSVYAKYVSISLARTYQTLGENEKAVRELCKVSGEKFYYSDEVKKKLYEIDAKLHPLNLLPLPEDAPLPAPPNPCARSQN